MEFPENYFEDEVREGFFIPSMMKRCWAAQMEVLSDIDALCRKYNIKYFADSGTLIGAVRHGGFIPWDDDMDIGMLREDYEKFLEHADELPSDCTILNWRKTEEWKNAYSRVVNTKFISFDEDHLTTYHGFPYAAGVDVFVMDYLYKDEVQEEERRKRATLLIQVASALTEQAIQNEEYWHMVESVEETYDVHFDKEKSLPLQIYACAEDALREVKSMDADELAFMAAWMKFHGSSCPKKAYENLMRVPFECTTIPIPVHYDEVLKSRYGNYMHVNKYGAMHDYPYYRAQEHMLEEKYGWKTWNYQWNPEELTLADHLRSEKHAEQDGIRAQIQQIEAMIALNPDLYGGLQGQVDALKQNLSLEKQNNDVVFLCFDSKYWKNYDYFYNKEKVAGENVYVMAIPYYETVMDGRVEHQHFVLDGYPEGVDVMPYDAYDLQKNHPKRIYFQVPYDAENPAFTVHPVFYSRELLKCTDELIYVPYLDIKELEYTDDKSFFSMNYYVKMPGVMHADKVMLPTENMREHYLKALIEFSGEEYRSFWKKKLLVEDYMSEEIHNGRKKVFYYTDAAPLIIYGEEALEKIRRNLNIFYDAKDNVELYWMVTSGTKDVLLEKNSKVYEKLMEIYHQYQKARWGRTIESDDDAVLEQMDAFYGDPGRLAHLCNANKIPVMIQNVEY